jgi:hypothetical protein
VFQHRYECHRAQVAIVSGNYAWNLDGEKAAPQPGRYLAGVPVAGFRQLEINLTPYGFLKAAQAASPTAILITLPRGGITWKSNGDAPVVHGHGQSFNDQNLLELVRTWVANRSTSTCCMNCATPNTKISPARNSLLSYIFISGPAGDHHPQIHGDQGD